ncbi:MAG: response regulator [Proteobacteria bacterium]|nr:response regulator [Pseudomonadota bacterium]
MKKKDRVKIFSALEVANICGVVNQTAINWIKKSYLKAFTTPGGQYRVYGEDLVSFMSDREMKIPSELNEFINLGTSSLLLVEEDDYFAWKFLDQIKSEYPNCLTCRAHDSFEAGNRVALEHTDIILLNGDMPGLNSEKVCRMIKSDSEKNNNKIIVFTENLNSETRESVLKAGADVYLKKPFDVDQISIYLE